ncbi:MAG: arginase family protein [Alphaproteobacteria bacterium]|nr:arginase family protein [Alphaproteobacteria bacterium]
MYGAATASTFLGLPSASLAEGAKADIAIFGAATATPYPSVGAYCAGAPRAIRAGIADWAGAREHMDFDLGGRMLPQGVTAVDCGDLAIDATDAAGNRAKITAAARGLLEGGAVPVVMGGDDSVPIPLFQAFEGRGPFIVLQVDAHIDWRDEVQGLKLGLSSTMRRASEMGWIKKIIQVGARGTGSARVSDFEDARAAGVTFVTGREVAAHGIKAALDAIPKGADLLVTIDCDGLDPTVIPGVIGPAPGGLSYWQAVELLQGAAQRAAIAAFDIVEFMPERDIQKQGALAAARLMANAIGLIARQRKR